MIYIYYWVQADFGMLMRMWDVGDSIVVVSTSNEQSYESSGGVAMDVAATITVATRIIAVETTTIAILGWAVGRWQHQHELWQHDGLGLT